ncbi:hypothetical protein MMC13_007854 [Lambiella insularis]|nr:hypothetical protein [Lambiella insularis]
MTNTYLDSLANSALANRNFFVELQKAPGAQYFVALDSQSPSLGFACAYDLRLQDPYDYIFDIPSNFSLYISYAITGKDLPYDSEYIKVPGLATYNWPYNQTEQSFVLGQTYDSYTVFPPGLRDTSEIMRLALGGVEVVVFQENNGTIAITHIVPDDVGGTFLNNNVLVPYSHISASSFAGNSTAYIYYQVNDTFLAELSYDVDSGFWSQPVMIPVLQA